MTQAATNPALEARAGTAPVTDEFAFAEALAAEELIPRVLQTLAGRACITCSFQAEDIVVLDLVRRRLPDIPVLFLDTGYHFREVYDYRDQLRELWNLNLVNLKAASTVAEQETSLGILYQSDPARCCGLRKVEPLMSALDGYDLWFTGLRREQSPTRRNLKKIERHILPAADASARDDAKPRSLLKINPIAEWTWSQVWNYVVTRGIPWLSLYDQGYRSIGCQPCTAIPAEGADPRSGRWSGRKLECGIHTFDRARGD
jgi:phosphoadenosine phosphosulfate reductase